jgi:hypothetical protein
MGARLVVRLLVAAAVAASTACTLWAALDDPYKSDTASSSAVDAGDAAPPIRAIDAGFDPYAIASLGDTVFVVDPNAAVHVAYDASTSFEPFWSGDAGDTFTTKNRIAASDAGVFWTTDKGIRYCALDGGACGLLARNTVPTAIAASDSMVAWIDTAPAVAPGIGRCSVPLGQCPPAPIHTGTNVPASLAVAPDGTVAWTFTQAMSIRFDGPSGKGELPLPLPADVLAADLASNNLYWEGPSALGVVPFDALVVEGGTAGTYATLTSLAQPNQLFADKGDVYWSISTPSVTDPQATATISYCRYSDAGCSPRGLGLLNKRVAQGVVATSRQVMAVLISPVDFGMPELLVWSSPFASSK